MSRILRLIYVIFVVVQGCERLLVWVARFGFLIYPLYGIVSWFIPSLMVADGIRAALVEALFSVLAASSVSHLIRCIWHRPRPFTRGRTARITHGDNASFPSNHTLDAVAAAFSLILSRQSGGTRLLWWALLQGLSRVFAGVHYTSDIIGSAVLAACCAAWVHSSRRLRKLSRQLAYVCTEAENILRQK